jgi:hypothetical protein
MAAGVGGRRLAVRLGLSLCLLLVAASARAQAERTPFEFAEAEVLTFRPGEANEVRVLNNTARPLSLDVSMVDLVSADGRGLSSFVEVGPNPLPVPAAGGATVVLSLKRGEALKPGAPLTAYLVISNSGSDNVKRRLVTVGTPANPGGSTDTAALKSLVGALKVTRYYWPLRGEREVILDQPLPLDTKKEPAAVSQNFKDGTVARLATTDGETARLSYEGVDQGLAAGSTGIKLGFKSDGAAGEYTGSPPGIKTGAGQPVTLTVVSKHHLLCAVAVIVAGVLTFYLMQWYLNVLRKVSLLDEQEAELESAFGRAEKHFKKTAAGRAYEEDSIRTDFKAQLAALLKEIKRLRFDNFVRLDESGAPFKSVITKLAGLSEVAQAWASFAESKLNPLDDALTAAAPGFAKKPPSLPSAVDKPTVALDAERLLAARGEVNVAEFQRRAAASDELLPRLLSWPGLNEEAAHVLGRFDDIISGQAFGQLDALLQQAAKEKREQAFLIWRRLWTRGDFDAEQVKSSLLDLEDDLAVMAGLNRKAGAAAMAIAAAAPAEAAAASPAERVAQIEHLRLGFDLFFFFLALAVSVYAGLVILYFDKPFGSVRDYVAAFLMSVGAKPALDLVVGALNKLTSRTA